MYLRIYASTYVHGYVCGCAESYRFHRAADSDCGNGARMLSVEPIIVHEAALLLLQLRSALGIVTLRTRLGAPLVITASGNPPRRSHYPYPATRSTTHSVKFRSPQHPRSAKFRNSRITRRTYDRQSVTSLAIPISGNPPPCHFFTCFTSRRISRIIRLVPHLTLQRPNQQIVSRRSQSMAKQPPTSTTRHLINNRCEPPVTTSRQHRISLLCHRRKNVDCESPLTTGDFLCQSHVYLPISRIKLGVTTHNREPWLRQLPPRLPSSIDSTTRL